MPLCHNKLSISKKIHFRAHYTASLWQITVGLLFKNLIKVENSELYSLNAALKKVTTLCIFKKCPCSYIVEMLLYCCRCQSSRLKRYENTKISLRNFFFIYIYIYKKVKLIKVNLQTKNKSSMHALYTSGL